MCTPLSSHYNSLSCCAKSITWCWLALSLVELFGDLSDTHVHYPAQGTSSEALLQSAKPCFGINRNPTADMFTIRTRWTPAHLACTPWYICLLLHWAPGGAISKFCQWRGLVPPERLDDAADVRSTMYLRLCPCQALAMTVGLHVVETLAPLLPVQNVVTMATQSRHPSTESWSISSLFQHRVFQLAQHSTLLLQRSTFPKSLFGVLLHNSCPFENAKPFDERRSQPHWNSRLRSFLLSCL